MVATRAVVGAPPSAYDGRTAFLLAFAEAAEIEVTPVDGPTEVVNVLFCGTVDEPLRVQRVGKARDEAASVVESGASGANAVPSLGYVQRSRSDGERRLIEAAERAALESVISTYGDSLEQLLQLMDDAMLADAQNEPDCCE